jgi:hypothetical protein
MSSFVYLAIPCYSSGVAWVWDGAPSYQLAVGVPPATPRWITPETSSEFPYWVMPRNGGGAQYLGLRGWSLRDDQGNCAADLATWDHLDSGLAFAGGTGGGAQLAIVKADVTGCFTAGGSAPDAFFCGNSHDAWTTGFRDVFMGSYVCRQAAIDVVFLGSRAGAIAYVDANPL